jgi:hypothetical protein
MTLNLNWAQRAILMLTAIALVALFLWPPWCYVTIRDAKRVQSLGHYSALGGPSYSRDLDQFRPVIDTALLAQETTALVILTVVLLVAIHGWTKINLPKLRLPRLIRIVLTRPRKIVLLATGICIVCMAIVPPWINSNPQSDHRGAFLGYAPIWNRPDGRTSARDVLDRLQADTTAAGREWREYQAMKAKRADSTAAPTITLEAVRAWQAQKAASHTTAEISKPTLREQYGAMKAKKDSLTVSQRPNPPWREMKAERGDSVATATGKRDPFAELGIERPTDEQKKVLLAEQARRDALRRAMPAPHVTLLAVQLAGLLVVAGISFVLLGPRSSPLEKDH